MRSGFIRDFGVPSLGSIRESFFGDDFFNSFFSGNFPEGTKTYKKDIFDDDGKKVGESVLRTYSSGKSNAPSEIIRGSFPPCNIYTDDSKKKFFEFACAGYDPKNVSFEICESNPSYITLVLKSEFEEVKEEDNSKDKEENKSEEKHRVYDYRKFDVGNHSCSFYLDRDRYDIESAEVEFENGVVRISFEPKKINFKPKGLIN